MGAFLRLNTDAFPDYMQELIGMAQGSKVPFEWLFLSNIEQEFASQLDRISEGDPSEGRLLPKAFVGTRGVDTDHCSDYMMCSAERCVDAHNEDNDGMWINHTFVLDAQLGGPEHRFLAFVYMGDLPSSAFGINAHGIGFSLNWVGPPPANAAGLARNFVSRSLLDGVDRRDTLARATRGGQAGGHNIQLFDFCARSIDNLEVDKDRHHLRRIGDEAFFHANQYQTLQVPGETFGPSSSHRLARAAALARPSTLEGMLEVLGDQGDRDYPIFHDSLSHQRGEKSDWTLATVVFDLDSRNVTILQGNPSQGRLHMTWNIGELIAGGGGCSVDSAPLVILS